VSYLKGYCPIPNVEALQAQGRAQGWGLLIEDPGPDDPAPTLLHNPRWVQPIKAIFKMIGIVPGYREFDISGVFLLFYSLFFAMLVGDAGYGLLFLALTGAIRLFARKAPPELPRLLGTLSVCTIVWGVLTGSYFGIRFESLPPLLRQGRVAWLTDEVHLMALCFLIGSIHLTIAHVWNAWRVRNSLAALAQIGWVAITWSMYYLAMNMILGRPLPAFVLPLFMGGLAGVVVFMTPLRMLKTDWPNHAMLPLSIIGSFGDVVSYVRLFAVGSAGTAISVAFNEMALSGGISSFGAGVGAALILFLAHAMNILLSALGVIVHGVRLNTLEFSGHLGMQWTGIPFKPFRKQEPGQE
jgi:V/A-type H+-transporting ATPase subunit I